LIKTYKTIISRVVFIGVSLCHTDSGCDMNPRQRK